MITEARTALRRVPPESWLIACAVVLPFLVSVIVLAGQRYAPVLDLAMTEVRVRDVFGRHTPLIGLPGRIGTFPDQGSHPGPLSFYLLAPLYWLVGRSGYGLLFAAATVNAVAALLAVWVVGRRGGRLLRRSFAGLVVVLTAWLGMSVLTQPWNPYLPLMPFLLAMVCAWAVLDGDHVMLLPLTVAASLCAQTHVPYLSLGVVLVGVGLVGAGRRILAGRRSGDDVSAQNRSLVAALAVGVALWLPVLVDQWRRDPGNVTMLRRHFLDPPEDPVGMASGLRVVLSRLDPWQVVSGLAGRGPRWIETVRDLGSGRWQFGAVVLVVWLVSVVVARRLTDRRVARLHVVVGSMLAVAIVSTGRIFGKVWYYLVLWVWVIGLLALLSIVFTLVVALRERSNGHPVGRRSMWAVSAAAIAAAVGALTMSTIDAVRAEPPEPQLSETLAFLADRTALMLRDGVGPAEDGAEGTYLVRFRDAAYFGSQSYGLVSELERLGIDARATTTYRVPMTPQRTIDPADTAVTAEVVLVTGSYLEEWRGRVDVVEVAAYDPRTDSEREVFERLRSESIDRLREAGLDDLVEMIDLNLFGLSIDPRVPADVERRLSEMLVLGVEAAVFVVPPGTVDAS
ncbi:MAG: hypothetical protein ACO3AV_01360 [Ilumatobacteraceae bacterium]